MATVAGRVHIRKRLPTNVHNALHIRHETKVVQGVATPRGPFKMFGYSVADLRFGATRRQMSAIPSTALHPPDPGRDRHPWALRPGHGMTDRLQKFLSHRRQPHGHLFDRRSYAAARRRLYDLMPRPGPKGHPLRAHLPRAGHLGQIPGRAAGELLRDALGGDYVLVEKAPSLCQKTAPQIPESCRDFAIGHDASSHVHRRSFCCGGPTCASQTLLLFWCLNTPFFRRP